KYREHLEELVEEQTSQLEEKTAELEHANIRLQELDRLKSMFIASMSHELRTPLNSIIGFTGMILQGLSGEVSKEANEELRIVYDSAKHLLSLINDVIDISKIEAGQLEAYFEEVDLDEVLRDAVTAVSRDADKKNLEIRTVIQGGLSVTSDRKRLLQCVMNLLENAVKFTEAGTIELIAAKEADTLRISVSDTGIGIREEDIPKLFAPFIRLDSPLKKRTLGTGLGLHLTKKIIKNVFHGNIMVESQYGMGSTFTLIIPLDAVV
ncbi:MAG TPA: HAMP domain-containing histidine kinase, partial [Methanosarcinales archaeon]|nr:HAMP domain-containing histidine kinase [Methanosarcinales archaeon]